MSMTLLDLFKDLSYGEFSQLNIGNLIPGESENAPTPAEYERIIGFTNLGLLELHKRFFLRSQEITVQQHEEIATYLLTSKYAASNLSSPIALSERYIIDTAENPFRDNMLKIEEVYDQEGNMCAMNDISNPLSVYTPTWRSVQIPYPDDLLSFSVQYRAGPDPIVYVDGIDLEATEVAVPNSMHEALLFYIASRSFAGFGGDQGQEGSSYWQKFRKSCDDVDKYGLEVQGEPGDWRFDVGGWV